VEELRETRAGTAVDMNGAGALLVRTDPGALHRVLAGDVRIIGGDTEVGTARGEEKR
jgi:hypothetical protein